MIILTSARSEGLSQVHMDLYTPAARSTAFHATITYSQAVQGGVGVGVEARLGGGRSQVEVEVEVEVDVEEGLGCYSVTCCVVLCCLLHMMQHTHSRQPAALLCVMYNIQCTIRNIQQKAIHSRHTNHQCNQKHLQIAVCH